MNLNLISKLLFAVAVSFTVTACGKLEYDWKGLGFASEAEMEAAHKIGYHTKAKLDEMRPKLAAEQVAAPVPPAPVAEPAAAAVAPAVVQGVVQAPAEVAPPVQIATATPPVADSKPISPSFDCAKASTDVERMICGDKKLAAIDNELSAGYKMIYKDAKPDEQARMKSEQIKWMKTSRNICKDVACIANAYEGRMREMTGD